MENLTSSEIIEKAIGYGATMAGIARIEALKKSPTYLVYSQNPHYDDFLSIPEWPVDMPSILVFGLEHSSSEPDMDWWDELPGGTPGNRKLIEIQKQMKKWLQEEKEVAARALPYKIEKGGVFLKDAAALAGLGVFGRNNLLLTTGYGASVRLRAMFLSVELETSGPSKFNPCADCDQFCFQACPQKAFRNGAYERKFCKIQMEMDEKNQSPQTENSELFFVRYCRECELACPSNFAL
ncbi:MAG: hypothetical protein JEZ06_11625 [Anaerolineaceae bacterium]|nr:hypothetical protein [Anaerolineaceae bacterium]